MPHSPKASKKRKLKPDSSTGSTAVSSESSCTESTKSALKSPSGEARGSNASGSGSGSGPASRRPDGKYIYVVGNRQRDRFLCPEMWKDGCTNPCMLRNRFNAYNMQQSACCQNSSNVRGMGKTCGPCPCPVPLMCHVKCIARGTGCCCDCLKPCSCSERPKPCCCYECLTPQPCGCQDTKPGCCSWGQDQCNNTTSCNQNKDESTTCPVKECSRESEQQQLTVAEGCEGPGFELNGKPVIIAIQTSGSQGKNKGGKTSSSSKASITNNSKGSSKAGSKNSSKTSTAAPNSKSGSKAGSKTASRSSSTKTFATVSDTKLKGGKSKRSTRSKSKLNLSAKSGTRNLGRASSAKGKKKSPTRVPSKKKF